MIYFQNTFRKIALRSPELKDSEITESNIIWKRSYTGALHNVIQASEDFFNLEFANLTVSSQKQLIDFITETGCSTFTYTDYSNNTHSVQFTEREITVSTEGKATGEEISAAVSIKLRRIT